jgi:hypothetical protein
MILIYLWDLVQDHLKLTKKRMFTPIQNNEFRFFN